MQACSDLGCITAFPAIKKTGAELSTICGPKNKAKGKEGEVPGHLPNYNYVAIVVQVGFVLWVYLLQVSPKGSLRLRTQSRACYLGHYAHTALTTVMHGAEKCLQLQR